MQSHASSGTCVKAFSVSYSLRLLNNKTHELPETQTNGTEEKEGGRQKEREKKKGIGGERNRVRREGWTRRENEWREGKRNERNNNNPPSHPLLMKSKNKERSSALDLK